jgi:phosphoesterase RecJ-like protein
LEFPVDECQQVIDFLASAKGNKVLLLTHARPDGDALGSAVAMHLALTAAGRSVELGLLTPWPSKYDFLVAPVAPLTIWERGLDMGAYDRVVVVDTCAYGQLEGLGEQLDRYRERIAVIDHHATRDPIGAVQWIDAHAPAAGEMVYRLIRQAGWAITRAIGEAVAVAVTTDTGWFRFSNTTPGCLRLMADLIDQGLDASSMYQRIYQNDTPQRVAMLGEMLRTLQLFCGNRVAVLRITQDMYTRTSSDPADTEGLIDVPQVIGSVLVTALLAERPGGGMRASFRSKGHVDVNAIAQQFGGGGHVRAAGAKIGGGETFEQVTAKIVAAVEKVLPGLM